MQCLASTQRVVAPAASITLCQVPQPGPVPDLACSEAFDMYMGVHAGLVAASELEKHHAAKLLERTDEGHALTHHKEVLSKCGGMRAYWPPFYSSMKNTIRSISKSCTEGLPVNVGAPQEYFAFQKQHWMQRTIITFGCCSSCIDAQVGLIRLGIHAKISVSISS